MLCLGCGSRAPPGGESPPFPSPLVTTVTRNHKKTASKTFISRGSPKGFQKVYQGSPTPQCQSEFIWRCVDGSESVIGLDGFQPKILKTLPYQSACEEQFSSTCMWNSWTVRPSISRGSTALGSVVVTRMNSSDYGEYAVLRKGMFRHESLYAFLVVLQCFIFLNLPTTVPRVYTIFQCLPYFFEFTVVRWPE